jgi:hypothetical protein
LWHVEAANKSSQAIVSKSAGFSWQKKKVGRPATEFSVKAEEWRGGNEYLMGKKLWLRELSKISQRGPGAFSCAFFDRNRIFGFADFRRWRLAARILSAR